MQKMTLNHTDKSRRFINEHHDNCTVCGRQFITSETTHLGYTSKKTLAYVGDCCVSTLVETIIRHSYSKRPYIVPSNEAKIWRFMDFTKFVSLISSQTLYFSRVDMFEDPFEGAKGLLINKDKWDKFYLSFFESACRNPPGGISNSKSDEEIKMEAKQSLEDLNQIGKRDLKTTFINCWHENEHESEAMWKLYTKNTGESVAIQTTYGKLYRSLGKDPAISIGRVEYIDYSKTYAGVNESFWFKRKSFEHEKEIRAVIKNLDLTNAVGIHRSVDLKLLFENVYVSPTAQTWFTLLVEEVLNKYNIDIHVKASNLSIEPFF